MAHFKRKRTRTRVKGNVQSMSSWPAWWDIIFHTRPKRRAAARLVEAVRRGDLDPDDACFPLGSHKPHNYYW